MPRSDIIIIACDLLDRSFSRLPSFRVCFGLFVVDTQALL